ncbi:hypothetical protein FGO68_gene6573 [Halteria grandinella]|uniref:Uncharacterized protein n=1 Tax=Halteria grandinella TaxID=5974 RepID=A0A8J8NRW7_HALGN|nr:hypothetical protein FGO68_gene6573 [Halteria grandinella]
MQQSFCKGGVPIRGQSRQNSMSSRCQLTPIPPKIVLDDDYVTVHQVGSFLSSEVKRRIRRQQLSKDLFLDFKIANQSHQECTIDVYHHELISTCVKSSNPLSAPLYSINFYDCNNYYDSMMVGDVFVLMFAKEVRFFLYQPERNGGGGGPGGSSGEQQIDEVLCDINQDDGPTAEPFSFHQAPGLSPNLVTCQINQQTTSSTSNLKHFSSISEIHRMQKHLGYDVFRGYNPRCFYFYNRDKKNLIITVEITIPKKGNRDQRQIKSHQYPFSIPNFQVDKIHMTGKVVNQYWIKARVKQGAQNGLREGEECYLLAKLKFMKLELITKVIKVFPLDTYFNENTTEQCSKSSRIFMLRHLHRRYVDPFLKPISSNLDLLYVCESQYRDNNPTLDNLKNLWIFTLDNFKIRNRHNLEEHTFEISDAANFVMITTPEKCSEQDGVYLMATPERKKQYIYKYLISLKDKAEEEAQSTI